ncbi:MAG: CAP domain-containing protein [Patescibacteria group bacterium]|nr:CAP domain-containing protein [Patescibacteria group bacterium]
MKKLLNIIHYFFLPKEENNFHGRGLHLDFLTYYLIFALILTFGFKKLNLTNILGFATDITVEKLYQLTNQKRQENGLPPLQYNDKLSQAAYKKAQDMFAKNYWAHFAPDGTSPWSFILSVGYQYEYAGENLAKNFMFSNGVVDAWMNSPTHRENILRREYSEIGFAVVNGVLNGEETTLVVQMFGKPLTTTIAKTENPIPFSKTVSAEEKVNSQKQPPPINNSSSLKNKNNEKIIQSAFNSSQKSINLTRFSFNLNFFFLSFLIIALLLDFYFALKFNIIKIKGKNLAHLIFLLFILLGLTLFTKGKIL